MNNRELLDYYLREMAYLKHAGADFAEEFPQVAARLNFEASDAAGDPHVTRLIESFAFLTAKLQHRIDNVASELTNALIDVLYPNMNRLLPAMSVARFDVNDGGNKPTRTGFSIPKGTNISASAPGDGGVCRFTTVYPLKLFPIRITDVSVVPSSTYNFVSVPNTIDFGYSKYKKLPTYFCEVVIECFSGMFSDLLMEDLLFYINIDDQKIKTHFYMSLTCGDFLVHCVCSDNTAIPMPPGSLQKLGFTRDEMALPPTHGESHAYQLLQEYLHFPEKFMFFRVAQLDFLKYLRNGTFLQTNQLKLLLPMYNASVELAKKIATDNLHLHTTPIVNLYHTITDPISIDHKRVFYQVMPNAYRDRTSEVYRINNVFAIEAKTGEVREVPPYFSLRDRATWFFEEEDGGEETNAIDTAESEGETGGEGKADRGGRSARSARGGDGESAKAARSMFWWSHCVPTHHENVTGLDTEIAFVDLDFDVLSSAEYTVYAKALCTNRFLAEDIPRNAQLQLEMAAPVDEIVCAQKPVLPRYHLDKGRNNARLVAQLAVNYLGFPYNGNNDISAGFRKILNMHASQSAKNQIDSMFSTLETINVSHATRRIGRDAWRGIVDGVQIDIILSQDIFVSKWYLLANVLQQFFAMNCQINTFVAVSLFVGDTKAASLGAISGEQLFV
jgi:type VI secretion system protein ImpG